MSNAAAAIGSVTATFFSPAEESLAECGNLRNCPAIPNYFASLKSARRLALIQELNQRLGRRILKSVPDPLAGYADLTNFDLYAGAGHWHAAAAHDAPQDGTKYARRKTEGRVI
jgi:hypothetical protein